MCLTAREAIRCDSALSGFRRKAGPAQVVSAMISDTIGYFCTASRPVRLIECTGRGIPTRKGRALRLPGESAPAR